MQTNDDDKKINFIESVSKDFKLYIFLGSIFFWNAFICIKLEDNHEIGPVAFANLKD